MLFSHFILGLSRYFSTKIFCACLISQLNLRMQPKIIENLQMLFLQQYKVARIEYKMFRCAISQIATYEGVSKSFRTGRLEVEL